MNEKKFAKEAELSNGYIGSARSLETFDTTYANTHVSSLNHRHVVGAVANGKEERFQIAFDKLDNQSLLKRRDTTTTCQSILIQAIFKINLPAQDRFAQDGQIQ
jgi:hypothetical protein